MFLYRLQFLKVHSCGTILRVFNLIRCYWLIWNNPQNQILFSQIFFSFQYNFNYKSNENFNIFWVKSVLPKKTIEVVLQSNITSTRNSKIFNQNRNTLFFNVVTQKTIVSFYYLKLWKIQIKTICQSCKSSELKKSFLLL